MGHTNRSIEAFNSACTSCRPSLSAFGKLCDAFSKIIFFPFTENINAVSNDITAVRQLISHPLFCLSVCIRHFPECLCIVDRDLFIFPIGDTITHVTLDRTRKCSVLRFVKYSRYRKMSHNTSFGA
jgi:hypothetical protein